jgi:hypothetical protein
MILCLLLFRSVELDETDTFGVKSDRRKGATISCEAIRDFAS